MGARKISGGQTATFIDDGRRRRFDPPPETALRSTAGDDASIHRRTTALWCPRE